MAVSTTKLSKRSSSRISSFTSRELVESAGLKYLAASLASSALPSYCVAPPWTICWRPLRVFGSSVLKSWSRSTGVVVSSASIWPPSSISLPSFGPGVSDT